MKTSRMKTPEYIKEFIATQHSAGALVQVYYQFEEGVALVYTNLTFRNSVRITLEDLEEMLAPYEKTQVVRRKNSAYYLKEVV